MENLDELRKEIDNIDSLLVECFEKRMKVVTKVAEYKRQAGLNTYDPNREKLVIEKNSAKLNDETLKPYFAEFMQRTMDLSKKYQNQLREEKNQ